jgi:EAL domain-containing protein (putative c-di-GMP-specific phosphodiesterase class I)
MVILEELPENPKEAATQAKIVGETILAALNEPYQLANHLHVSTPSIGITLFGSQKVEVDELIKQAELAMYQSKAAGRNTLRFFDPQMQATVNLRASLESRLRDALSQNQLILHYQPQVDGKGQITGSEALVRWLDPKRGMVAPNEFIPVAEECGLILPLGQWVLDSACSALAKWAKDPAMAQLTVAVNVSTRQFRLSTFFDEVLATLKRTGANPQRLKLEMTESMLVEDIEMVIAKMTALRGYGVTFSLDDFGTGYSSLAYLKRLPLDQLKIDQGFVRDILIDSNDAAIAKTVIALAGSMGLAVIAEGVETEEQRDFLANAGCLAYQGYLFSKPLPLNEFEALVKGV